MGAIPEFSTRSFWAAAEKRLRAFTLVSSGLAPIAMEESSGNELPDSFSKCCRATTSPESSALPNSPIASSSSPASAILLAASSQPLRAGLAGLRNTSAPSSIVISAPTLLCRPNCASAGLGMTTAWELPIRRILTCTDRIVITMLFRMRLVFRSGTCVGLPAKQARQVVSGSPVQGERISLRRMVSTHRFHP